MKLKELLNNKVFLMCLVLVDIVSLALDCRKLIKVTRKQG